LFQIYYGRNLVAFYYPFSGYINITKKDFLYEVRGVQILVAYVAAVLSVSCVADRIVECSTASKCNVLLTDVTFKRDMYEGVSKSFRTKSITK